MAFGDFGGGSSFGLGQQPSQFAPYPEDEEQRLIDTYILSKAKGGLQYAAETLDKPGRAMRGLLAGRPSELLNLVPFSDTLGLTDPAQSTSGRDLLEQYGVLDKNTPGLDVGDVAGFGAEILTDPLTYTGLGALTKAGKAASKTTGLTKGIGNQIAKGERSLLSVGLPFTQGAEFGAGSQAIGDFVQKGADKAAKSAPGRFGRMLLDSKAGGHFGEAEQAISTRKAELVPALERQAHTDFDPLVEELDVLFPKYKDELSVSGYGIASPDLRMQFEDYMRNLRETGDHMNGVGLTPAFKHQTETLVNKYAGLRDTYRQKLIDEGAPDNLLHELGLTGKPDSGVLHDPRYADKSRPPSIFAGRRDVLKDLPADVVNKMGLDPDIRSSKALPREMAVQTVIDRYGVHLPAVSPESMRIMAENVVDEFAGEPVERMFKNLWHKDTETYLMKSARTLAQMQATRKAITDSLSASGGIPLERAFGQLDMDAAAAITKIASETGIAPDALAKMHVAPDVVNAVGTVHRKLVEPEWRSRITDAYDTVMNLWKRYTLAMPSTQTRNLAGGQFVNMTSDLIEKFGDIPSYLGSMKFVDGIWRKTVKGKPLTKAEAEFASTMKNSGLMDATMLEDMGLGRTRETVIPPKQILGGGIGETFNMADQWIASKPSMIDSVPFGVGKGIRKIGETAAKQGQKAQHLIEWYNRAAPLHFAMEKKGYAFEPAIQKVKQLQFDYKELSPFEQQVMKRLMPFYSFQRKIMPLTFQSIAQRPGGPTAQAIRGTQQGRQEVGFVPEYIGEGAAIPLSESRYLSSFGLPFEQAFAPMLSAPTVSQTVGRTLEKNIAGLAPWISGTYALASGREPFSGRELSELYPYPTSSTTANVLLQRTPYGRTIGTTRTLLDERKGPLAKAADLLTGVKVTDVSGGIERQKALEARRVLGNILSESPRIGSYTSYYADPRAGGALTEEEVRNLKLLRGMEKHGREHSKKQKLTEQQAFLLNR